MCLNNVIIMDKQFEEYKKLGGEYVDEWNEHVFSKITKGDTSSVSLLYLEQKRPSEESILQVEARSLACLRTIYIPTLSIKTDDDFQERIFVNGKPYSRIIPAYPCVPLIKYSCIGVKSNFEEECGIYIEIIKTPKKDVELDCFCIFLSGTMIEHVSIRNGFAHTKCVSVRSILEIQN